MPKKAVKPVPKFVPAKPVRNGMPRREAAPFAALLKAKQRLLSGDISHMEEEAMKRGKQENAAQDISSFADLGTDNFEQDFTIGLIENEADALQEIELALERIQEGAYGVCETCNKRVSKERLRVIPFTRHCIECQRKEEHTPD